MFLFETKTSEFSQILASLQWNDIRFIIYWSFKNMNALIICITSYLVFFIYNSGLKFVLTFEGHQGCIYLIKNTVEIVKYIII